MKSRLLSAILFSVISTMSASATLVTFNTIGSNFTSTGTNSVQLGNVTLAHDIISPSYTVTTPSAPGFGQFVLTCVDTACTSLDPNTPVTETFTLLINQSVPTGGNGQFTGSLTGSISLFGGVATIAFSSNQLLIGDIIYTLTQPTLTITTAQVAGALGTSGLPTGTTTIQGTVTSVPEPGTYAMLGTALLGLGLLRRRK